MTGLARIWLAPVTLPPPGVSGWLELLDDGEQARAAALPDAADRQRYTVAHAALRMLAGHALHVPPAALHWVAGPHGKPRLAPPWSALHTSLSHSGDMIAAAISAGRPVGIDIQQVIPGPGPVRLSARFFPPAEASYVAAGGQRGQGDRFTWLWTRKEAVVKAAGATLWSSLATPVAGRDAVVLAQPPSVHRVADVAAPPGYRAAVALAGATSFIVSDVSAKEPQLWDSP